MRAWGRCLQKLHLTLQMGQVGGRASQGISGGGPHAVGAPWLRDMEVLGHLHQDWGDSLTGVGPK